MENHTLQELELGPVWCHHNLTSNLTSDVHNKRRFSGALDLEKVCAYLREQVQCDGQGPVFVKRYVVHAIKASVIGITGTSV